MRPNIIRLSRLVPALLVGSFSPVWAFGQPAAAPPAKVVIHYHRFDGDYDQAGLWTWDGREQKSPKDQEIMATGKDEFGITFELDPSKYGNDDSPKEKIGFIPRRQKDWNKKDGADRFWTPDKGAEVWLVGNDPGLYTSKPDISPRIQHAFIDGIRLITVSLSHPIKAGEGSPAGFLVKRQDGHNVPVEKVAQASGRGSSTDGRLVELSLGADLDITEGSYEVSREGYRAAVATPRNILFDASHFKPNAPLGAIYSPTETTFRVFTPLAENVAVVLYDQPTGTAGRSEIPMKKVSPGVWEAVATGDLEGKHYHLKVKTHKYGEKELNDPYATNTTGHDSAARITNLRKQDPVGFRPIKRPTFGTALPDAVIYQLHVRDFTIDKNSGVSDKNRGKFLGLTETGTRLPGDSKVKTGLDHLRELGVTHVQLQPIQDFDNDEDHPTYNWGYMTAFFNSPDGWFASDHRGAARIAEFKKLVQALHDAGIGVIMDVVYNHTGTQNTLEFIAPGYYLRMRDDGSFWNGSGTGNEFRSEAPMGRQFIVDSLKFWVEEYGVDGFRLDLMGLIDLDTLKEAKVSLEKINPNVLFYGEPWAATGPDGSGAAKLTYKDVIKGTGIAAFNDHFRDAIKGSPDGKDAGYIVSGDRRDALVKGIAGSIDDWTASPVEAINYASVHDNLDLWDKLKVSAPGTSDEDRAKMVMLAGGILAVSQGAPLFHCGVDFCRDKQGNNNSYNAGDEVNQIDWSRKKTYANVNAFFQGAIAIRRAHPVFRMKTAEDVRKRLKFVNSDLPDPKAVAFTLDAAGLDNEPWNKVAVFINPTSSPLKFKLPFEGEGAIQMQNGKAGTVPLGRATGSVDAGPHSMTLVAW